MEKILVKKSMGLRGNIRVDGSKNSILPILAATLLSEEECLIHDIPDLQDVHIMCKLLEELGAKIEKPEENTLKISAANIKTCEAPYELISKMRASFLVMGPLLARCHNAKVYMPGGCAIGTRPIDLHLKGLKYLGAEINSESGYVHATTKMLVGNDIYIDFPSVGATENIIMAATLAEGETILENAAEEPEIVDLANFINSMGGNIIGAGTKTIRIRGVKKLHKTEHTVIPDRIEAGTYMVAAAATGGHVIVENVVPSHLQPVVAKLREAGARVEEFDDKVRVVSDGEIKPVDIKTLPYPGFPTDMQAQFMAMLSVADGTSIIPISKVALGFLAGGGEYGKAYGNPPAEMAFGGGSGAGVSVNPVGFLVVHGEHIRFMPVEGQMAMEKLVDLAPGLISQVQGMFKKNNKSNADEIEV